MPTEAGRPRTRTGVARAAVVPSPRTPSSFLPQHRMAPPPTSAHARAPARDRLVLEDGAGAPAAGDDRPGAATDRHRHGHERHGRMPRAEERRPTPATHLAVRVDRAGVAEARGDRQRAAEALDGLGLS